MNVYVIGSVSQAEQIFEVAKQYESKGNNVRYVKEEDGYLMDLIDKCFEIIREWADLIVVVPKCVHPVVSIGHGCMYEITYAKTLKKMVVVQDIRKE